MPDTLWDEIEEDKNKKIEEVQDFSNKQYRDSLLNTLTQYGIENNIIDELFQNFSSNIKNLSTEDKEKFLEVFTENAKLLNSTNSYLKNPIKGIKLISTIISSNSYQEQNSLEINFDKFNLFIENDFIEFSNQLAINNETELYQSLLNIRNKLEYDVKFSELVNKTHIGIGGSFSVGKSSFLNSILEEEIADDILPIDSVPTTSIPTFIVKKNQINMGSNPIEIFTFNKNGDKAKIDKESLLAISHEFNKVYKFGLTSIINKIVVELQNTPYENIAFLDTPGYSKSDGTENIDNTLAQNHLANIDSMIWLIDIDNGTIRNGDIKFIKSLNFKGDILFVINKADKKPLNDIKNILDAIKDTLEKSYIKYIDIVAYSSHEKKEYLSHNKINDFLNNRNRAKVVNFEKSIVDIFDKYAFHLNGLDMKNKQLLKLLNQIDLFGDKFVSSVDNFEVILSNTKEESNKNKKDRNLYENTLNKVVNLISVIDNEFNKNISINDKFKAGKYSDVLEDCNRELSKNNYQIETYLVRAKSHYNLKNYRMAILDYTKVIAIGGDHLSFVYRERGNAYMQLNQYQETLKDYEKVLDLSPNNKEITDVINLLKKHLQLGN